LSTLGLGKKEKIGRGKGKIFSFPLSFWPQKEVCAEASEVKVVRQPPAGFGLDRKASGGAIIMIGL